MPRFAARTDGWSATPNPLTRALERRRAAGREVLDLTESNPTRCGFAYPSEEILEALSGSSALRYEPDPLGMPAARAAIADDYAARGTSVLPDRLLLTASTSEAYGFLFKLLADPGGRVLVPSPSYPLFELLAQTHDVVLRHYPLLSGRRFAIDREALEVAVGDGAAALLVVNPGNPTGTFLSRDDAEALLGLCARAGIPLICDEVFGDYGWAGDPAQPGTLAGPRDEGLVFVLNGLSKMLALPQLKLGWIAAGGAAAEVAEAMRRLEIIADTFLSVATPVQAGLRRLLSLRPAVQAMVLERVSSNRRWLEAAVPAHSSCRLLPAEGGWASILQVPRTRPDDGWALELLEEDGVLVHPGYFFDFHDDGHLVLSLLPPPSVFQDGVTRLLARVTGPDQRP
ncbi:MAG: pyridoxal phosphate-dependent aminotransferase [Candidatus Polarisedimenticolia bacterium]